ncbi:LINE-1 type transposase domain containing protein 1 [Dissostichus eleginoides]|uniref:LINE-1 type transposase domain containing protein 1 n=1 Tax=Dissostichus eleginoides TaxID=100907 RepID=A0AAD9FM12_DISEL|nr:LINE-1 type transposase domain containing protein 1 [Dissostichus eleginoides]
MEDAQSSVSSVSSQQDSADTMRSVLQEICDFRAEHEVDLNKLKEEIKGDMKSELEDMKKEIYQKLSANSALTQAHETRLKEAEERIDEAETVNMAMSDALIKSMKEQRAVQGKLVDLEGRSRRNNMCIRVPEEKEGNSMSDFVDQLLKTELALPDTNLQIQRAHRAVARKPEKNAPPRSIVVNFLEFTTKEMVLKKAWEKKILMEGRRLSFDLDYATEVVLKRKA